MNLEANPGGSSSRNPVKLLVKTRDPSSSTSSHAQSDSVKESLRRKSELKRKAEKWGDKMMEETLTTKELKRGLKYISPPAYLEITHERHLNHLCSYPLCSNSPRDEYQQGTRYSISTSSRSIKPVEGNRDDGYCSKKCKHRSDWVYEQLEKRARIGDSDEITLLEEMDESNGIEESNLHPRTIKNENHVKRTPPTLSTKPEDGLGTTPALETLIGDITIYERPTPILPPTPPSLNPLASPAPSSPRSETKSQSSNTPTSRRAQSSSLVPTPSKLVNTILSSSRNIPSAQLEDDSDSAESLLDPEEENPLGMGGWSEDEEVKALFEEARAARELMKDYDDDT